MNVASLVVKIGADVSGLEAGAQKAQSVFAGIRSSAAGAFSSMQEAARAATSRTREHLETFGKSATTLGSVLSIGVSAPLALMARQAVNSAADVQQAVANISTIKPDIETSAVFNALNEMQTRVPQAAKELGDSLYDVFSSVNVSQADGIRLVEKFARGAVGAQTDAKTFGTSVMGVMNAYGKSVKDADHISDLFFNTVKSGVVTGQQLASSLGPVTSAARAAGQSMESLFAAITAATKEGGDAAQNVNNVSNLFQKLTTATAAKGFKELGITLSDAKGNFKQIGDVVTEFIGKTKGLSDVAKANLINKIFPDAQAKQAFQTLVRESDALNASLKENVFSAGAAKAAYEKMSATFQSQSALLKNSFNAILTVIGSEILPVLTPLVKQFAEHLPGAIKTLRVFLDGLAPSVKTGAVAFGAFVIVLGPVIAAAGAVATAIGAIGIPVALAIAAVLALGAAFAANVGGIRTTAMSVLVPVGAAIVGAFNGVKAWFTANMPLIRETVSTVLTTIAELWHNHGARIMAIVGPLWQFVKDVVVNAVKLIGNVVKLGMDVITGHWSAAGSDLKAIAGNLWAVLKSLFVNGVKAVGNTLLLIVSAVVDLGARLLTAARHVGEQIWHGLVGGIQAGLQPIADAAFALGQKAIDAAKSALGVQSPSKKFREVGHWTALGLAEGIKNGTMSVEQAARVLAQQATSGAARHVQAAKSELQKEAASYVKVLAGLKAQERAALAGGDTTDAARFRLLPAAWQENIAHVRAHIAATKEAQAAQQKFTQTLLETRAALASAKAGDGLPKLRVEFPGVSDAALKGLLSYQTQLENTTRANDAAKAAHDAMTQAVEQARLKLLEAGAATDAERVALEQFNKPLSELPADAQKAAAAIADYNAQTSVLATMQAAAGAAQHSINDAVAQAQQQYLLLTATTDAQRVALETLHQSYDSLTPAQQAEIDMLAQMQGRNKGLTDAQKQATDAAKGQADITTRLRENLADLIAKSAALAGHQTALSEVARGLHIDYSTLTDDQKKLLQEITQASAQVDAQQRQHDRLQEIAGGVKDVWKGAIGDMMTHTQGFFTSVKNGFTRMFQQIAQEYLANQIMRMLLGAVGGSAFASSLGFGGARAEGGPVSGGTPYLVGERGPELIVPRGSGTVVPNNALGGGASRDVHIGAINVHMKPSGNPQADRRSAQQAGAEIYAEIRRAHARS